MTQSSNAIPVSGERLAELIAWLEKRGQPDSGIDYEGPYYGWSGRRNARVTLHGEDAKFIADNFHGQGARDLAAALLTLRATKGELVDALTPFSFNGAAIDLTAFDGDTHIDIHFPTRRADKATPVGWVDVDAVLLARTALSRSGVSKI